MDRSLPSNIGHLVEYLGRRRNIGFAHSPYLLRNAQITRTDQVWAADITYLPMARGFLYLVA